MYERGKNQPLGQKKYSKTHSYSKTIPFTTLKFSTFNLIWHVTEVKKPYSDRFQSMLSFHWLTKTKIPTSADVQLSRLCWLIEIWCNVSIYWTVTLIICHHNLVETSIFSSAKRLEHFKSANDRRHDILSHYVGH